VFTSFAPRIDDRLRAFIAGSLPRETAAEVTRQVGDLAWELGLPRPSYQRVRLLLAERRPRGGAVSTRKAEVARFVLKAIDVLYEYPAPGMRKWYLNHIGRGSYL
jgi:hypothetical protein